MINPALCINHVAADVSPRTLKIFSADSRRRLRLVGPMLSPNGVRAHHGPIIVRGRGFGAGKAVRADDADHPPRRRAFTLIELLVGCGGLGIFGALIAGSFKSAKGKSGPAQ